MNKEKPSIAVEFDDASVVNPAMPEAWGIFESFKERYPGFKVSLFLTPWEVRYGSHGYLTHKDAKNQLQVMLEAYKRGWVQYCLHGLTHLPMEFAELNYEEAKKRILVAEKIIKEAGMTVEKIFKAPNWAISKEAKGAVQDMGYKVVSDFYYQWNLADPIPKLQEFNGQTIIAHGHIQDGDGCNNGVAETAYKIRELPEDTQFKFLTEVI
jgi:peptidoglycan/xylan/chitin deacetylase (PgdA/CDA1 family)